MLARCGRVVAACDDGGDAKLVMEYRFGREKAEGKAFAYSGGLGGSLEAII